VARYEQQIVDVSHPPRLCAMMTLPANQKADNAQRAKRKAATGKRKGKRGRL